MARVCGSTFINVTVCGAPCEWAGADSATVRDAALTSMIDRRIVEPFPSMGGIEEASSEAKLCTLRISKSTLSCVVDAVSNPHVGTFDESHQIGPFPSGRSPGRHGPEQMPGRPRRRRSALVCRIVQIHPLLPRSLKSPLLLNCYRVAPSGNFRVAAAIYDSVMVTNLQKWERNVEDRGPHTSGRGDRCLSRGGRPTRPLRSRGRWLWK